MPTTYTMPLILKPATIPSFISSSHHSLHHLYISNPATVPSPFGEGVSVGLSGEGQDSMAPGTNNEKSPAVL